MLASGSSLTDELAVGTPNEMRESPPGPVLVTNTPAAAWAWCSAAEAQANAADSAAVRACLHRKGATWGA